ADFRHFKDWAWLALGAATAFVGHELGHVVTDLILRKSIKFVGVKLGPFPFFAIQPCCNLSRGEEYAIASAGFLVGGVSSELVFWLTPRLRSRRAGFLKGVVVFDIALALGYAISGFAGVGPAQSDVNSMARGLDVPSWQVGLLLFVPAVVDV